MILILDFSNLLTWLTTRLLPALCQYWDPNPPILPILPFLVHHLLLLLRQSVTEPPILKLLFSFLLLLVHHCRQWEPEPPIPISLLVYNHRQQDPDPSFHFHKLASSSSYCSCSSSAGAWPTVINHPSINPLNVQGVAASRNQQNMAFANENNNIQMLMRLGLCEDYWKIIKVLTHSDVNHSQCRLLLPRNCVEKHILRSIQRRDADQCSSADGLPITVRDTDESRDEYVLCLKQCHSTNSYVLTGRWILDFVTRKRLKEGDKVGLTYLGSQLYFKHLN